MADGNIYYESENNLYLVNAESKHSTQITHFKEDDFKTATEFNVSPNQKSAVFSGYTSQSDIWLLDLETNALRNLTRDKESDHNPIWCADGKRIVYSSIRDGRTKMYLLDTTERNPQPFPIPDTKGGKFAANMSDDGSKILVYESENAASVFSTPSSGQGSERQLTSNVEMEFWPSTSYDGTKVSYQKLSDDKILNPTATSLVYQDAGTTTGTTQLSNDSFEAVWSPVTDQIAYLKRVGTVFDIWALDGPGKEPRKLTNGGVAFSGYLQSPLNLYQAADFSWSPRGREITYILKQYNDPTVLYNIFVVGIDDKNEAGENWSGNSDTNRVIHSPIWSPDGTQIAYVYKVIGDNPSKDNDLASLHRSSRRIAGRLFDEF